MDDIPKQIVDYLFECIGGEKIFSLLALNLDGAILEWYGDPDHFIGSLPEKGTDIYGYCAILEGILPLESKQAVLPNIEMIHGGIFADIHLLFHDEMYWILFVDSTQSVEDMREWLQDHNEAIFRRKNKENDESSQHD